jgi:hypothetical protein
MGRHIVAEFKPFKDLVFLSFQDIAASTDILQGII